ncbi:MAG: leucine-rich repeat domain-containing protein [Planctomycetota bacterium]
MRRAKYLAVALLAAAIGMLLALLVRERQELESLSPSAPVSRPPSGHEGPEAPAGESWTEQRAHAAIRERNPEYNGRGWFLVERGEVVAAAREGTGISDLSPLRGMPLCALDVRENPVEDLAPLEGMPLTELYLEGTKVSDLRPLQGMQLVTLYLNDTPVQDITPLHGMPLETLNLYGTKVSDLEPLRGVQVRMLWLNGTPVSDISPIAACPLVSLTLERTQVRDLAPLVGSSLQRLHIAETPVADLSPIAHLPLTRLIFTPARIQKGVEIARGKKAIIEIGTSFERRMKPARFWELYDKGELD